jgi:hypothetical protein
VQLYESHAELVDAVGTFLGGALSGDDAVVVVATDAHRDGLRKALTAAGLDLDALAEANRYFSLDASRVLATFLSNGQVDDVRFRRVIGGLVDQAAASGRKVRVFGEMVAVLWDEGNVPAAIELEEQWNGLAESRSFDLFCAYSTSSFGPEDVTLLAEVCRRHSHVLPPA